ncbi:uncharacterized protein PSFLO_05696 [Pseudozyma flocculosa]|uniref:Uncharacterized protein n=1 Tax=Pseudozyma flocculosa TaxID=84751 RepID=A0A5C3F6P7_9BASI|nr:uncharacterized protein PSFLO_05696 [Pseudozyma flocculosa]
MLYVFILVDRTCINIIQLFKATGQFDAKPHGGALCQPAVRWEHVDCAINLINDNATAMMREIFEHVQSRFPALSCSERTFARALNKQLRMTLTASGRDSATVPGVADLLS